MFNKTGLVFGILILTSTTWADVKLPAIFGDHMVLQQKATVTVWGWAEPGEKVRVKGSWDWFGKSTRADEDGTWSVQIRTPRTGKTVSLKVKGNNEIVLNDILLGEVWICSGQSNMEWRMNMLGTDRGADDIAAADYPNLRLFTVKKAFSATPLEDVEGAWQICSPQTVDNFSATGYYFGKNLNEALDIPIGLINTNWGGTKAEVWTSKETLKSFEQFSSELDMLENPANTQAEAEQKHRQQIAAWQQSLVKIDPGLQEQWYKSAFDDSDWKEMDLPSVWNGTDLASVDGIVWFRRTTNLPPSWAKREMQLNLGAIDDIDTLWINGVEIGTTNGWDKPRVYKIPASVLRVGKNSIVVRVIDGQGEGGFSGSKDDMRIGPPGAEEKSTATVAGKWKYKLSHKGGVPRVPRNQYDINHDTATALYNAMIAPLIQYRITGAIWYQGESNCYDPIGYRTLFPAMITDWRQQWSQGDFPFYYVQIAPHAYRSGETSQAIREAQMMTLDAVENVGMAVTMDIGEKKDIHPRNKHDVGDRLARWALTKTYGKKDIVYSGPIYKSMAVEGNKIRISFDYVDGGLIAKDGGLTDFEIAGTDQKFVPATAVIDGEAVIVSSDEVKEPVAIRYGWSNWVSGSLFNKAGLPASSFRTDDWPLQ